MTRSAREVSRWIWLRLEGGLACERGGGTDLCISEADVLIPRHNSSRTPATAMQSRNLVLVKNDHTALVGGSWALAAFQLKPPFGRSMM